MQISEHLKSELENERRNTKQTLRTSLAGCEVNERLVNKFGSVKDRWISELQLIQLSEFDLIV